MSRDQGMCGAGVGRALVAGMFVLLAFSAAQADTFTFNSGSPDGRMGMASRPDSTGKIEIEAADDFIAGSQTRINHATFTGLITGATAPGTPGQIVVEIYRVFPNDSNTTRTITVPTRTNSPSDVAFDSRDSATAQLTYTATTLSQSFIANNSVLNGINPSPNQTTGGEGAVTGQEVRFDVTFATPFDLPADHYFFIPQVQVTGGEFYWLSAAKPISGTGTTPFTPDLQAWIRNANLDPDWLRVGTDIVGGTTPPTFNGAFTLDGTSTPVPAPSSAGAVLLLIGALTGRRLIGVRRHQTADQA